MEFTGEGASFEWGENGLELHLSGWTWLANENFQRVSRELNREAVFYLADRTTLVCALHLTSTSTKLGPGGSSRVVTLELDHWTWQRPGTPCFWIIQVQGVRVRDGNLAVCTPHGQSAGHIRIDSNYQLYLLTTRSKQAVLLVDTGDLPLDLGVLGAEVQALEFSLGRRLNITALIGVDEEVRPVGAADPSFSRDDASTSSGRCPVPQPGGGCWVATLASRVARRIVSDRREDAPMLIATTVYLDSLHGNMHARYLQAQVALEAVAKKVVTAADPLLVADLHAWQRFVGAHREEIEHLAAGPDAAKVLLARLNYSVVQPASGDRVRRALLHLGISPPREVYQEIARRHGPAHDYVMYASEHPDVQVLADRVAIIQTILVAVVAKMAGYGGPILGWEWDAGRLTVPGWWKVEDVDDAHWRFIVVDEHDG